MATPTAPRSLIGLQSKHMLRFLLWMHARTLRQYLHACRTFLCSQILGPPHSTHLPDILPCWHRFGPPIPAAAQSLQLYLSLKCMQIPPPPPVPSRLQSLQLNLARNRKDSRTRFDTHFQLKNRISTSFLSIYTLKYYLAKIYAKFALRNTMDEVQTKGAAEQRVRYKKTLVCKYLRLPCWQIAPPWHSLHLQSQLHYPHAVGL